MLFLCVVHQNLWTNVQECTAFSTNAFYKIWKKSIKKKMFLEHTKSNWGFAFLKTIEVGQLFYFKTLLFIANLKFLMSFFFDILKLFPTSTQSQIAKCYIFIKKPISFWTNSDNQKLQNNFRIYSWFIFEKTNKIKEPCFKQKKVGQFL